MARLVYVGFVVCFLPVLAFAKPFPKSAQRLHGKKAFKEARKAPETVTPRERVEVEEVLALQDDQFVVLLKTVDGPRRYLPIWIGANEALAIRLKLDRQRPPRPLTLNLLESIMRQGNIELREIAIDSLRGGVFLGKITVSQGTRKWKIDSRPSDAIGLALGTDAPIWVSKTVLEGAAFDPEKLEDDEPAPQVDYSETL